MKNSLIIFIIVLILVGAGAFFIGMKYQQGKTPQFPGQRNGQFRQGSRTNGQSGQAIRGEVISTSDKSLTVKLSDGQSKIVLFSDQTSIGEQTQATRSAIKNGANVMIFGSTNSDGSVTAQSIQLNPPAGNRFPGGPQGSQENQGAAGQ